MKLAIVGIFYDGYYDLWEDFLALFKKNWNDCPFPLYIINNEKQLNYSDEYNVKVLNAGKYAEYSYKVQIAVESIDAEYILLLLEDFYITSKPQINIIKSIIDMMQKKDIKYYKMPMPEFTPHYLRGKISKISPNEEYTLTCQPSIWKKDFLRMCIGKENYNAWIFEGIYSKAPQAHTEEFLNCCMVDYRNIFNIRHGALQGEILPETNRILCESGYTLKTSRKVLSKKSVFIYHFKQKIKFYIPVKIQNFIKKLKLGNSVLDRYDNDIQKLIIKMGLR